MSVGQQWNESQVVVGRKQHKQRKMSDTLSCSLAKIEHWLWCCATSPDWVKLNRLVKTYVINKCGKFCVKIFLHYIDRDFRVGIFYFASPCILQFTIPVSTLSPLGHIWDVLLVWRKGNMNKNCLCTTVLCTIIMVLKGTSSSYRSVNCIGLWSCLVYLSVFQVHLCLWSSWCYTDIKNMFCLHPSIYLLVSWA